MNTSYTYDRSYSDNIIIKECGKYVNHRLIFYARTTTNAGTTAEDEVYKIVMQIQFNKSTIAITWFLFLEELYVGQIKEHNKIPFFMPDFSDCYKLTQKIKTYLVFS